MYSLNNLKNNKMYINGKWIEPTTGKLHSVKNRTNGSEVGTYYMGSVKDTTDAINAADKAFKQWKKKPALWE